MSHFGYWFNTSVDMLIYQEILSHDEQKKIELLSTSINEELLLQNTVIAYYEQQRNELIEQQKMVLNDLKVETTVIKNTDSSYTSIHSQSNSPNSLYECSGFASMDNLEVSNPSFSTDMFRDNRQVSMTLPLITK
ncbi:unnamed protein product [Rotaria sp. Silwood2]|nr:unnamed protein product [Rotaria sp. Silwood2]